VSNPAFSRDALSPAAAIALLGENLTHPGHQFWIDDVPVPSVIEDVESGLQGYRQLTDAYLLTVAHRRKGLSRRSIAAFGASPGKR